MERYLEKTHLSETNATREGVTSEKQTRFILKTPSPGPIKIRRGEQITNRLYTQDLNLDFATFSSRKVVLIDLQQLNSAQE